VESRTNESAADISRDVVIADAMQNWARVLEEVISCYWPQWFAFTPLS